MATTDFVDGVTVIEEEWMDHLDNFFYTIFGGTTYANQSINIDNTTGNVSILDSAGGTALFLDVANNGLQVGKGLTTETSYIELGTGRTGDGQCLIDLVSDPTNTFYSTRLIRSPGVNGAATLSNKGTGGLTLEQVDAGSIALSTNSTTRATIDSSGNMGLGIATPDSNLHVWNGSAGTVSASATTLLTLENSTHARFQILTPNTATGSIYFGDPDDNDIGRIDYNHVTDSINLYAAATLVASVDDDATAGNTRLLIYDVDNATLERVSVGAADSGGAGYKVLRIAN